jgi:hypothetical protein
MNKTRRAARSLERPGRPKENPSGLPYGCGSIMMRGRTWWMIYRDGEGRTIQENTWTTDKRVARYMVTYRALETARAKVAALERILNEEAPYAKALAARGTDHGYDRVRDREKYERGYRPIRNDATQRRDGRTAHRGGKA